MWETLLCDTFAMFMATVAIFILQHPYLVVWCRINMPWQYTIISTRSCNVFLQRLLFFFLMIALVEWCEEARHFSFLPPLLGGPYGNRTVPVTGCQMYWMYNEVILQRRHCRGPVLSLRTFSLKYNKIPGRHSPHGNYIPGDVMAFQDSNQCSKTSHWCQVGIGCLMILKHFQNLVEMYT